MQKCLGEKCPNNCCSNKFRGLSKALSNLDSSKFVQIQLNEEEVKKIKCAGREDLLENKKGEYFLKLNDDNSCSAFKNGQCSIYDIRPDVCRLYPYYFDPFCGICIDRNCPGDFSLDISKNEIYNLLNNRISLYNNSQHFFFDGYEIDNKILSNIQVIHKFLEEVNKKLTGGKCKLTLIPYFDGKVKEDGGISGVLLGTNFHFTCHTFSYKNTVFIDCYGKSNYEKQLLPIIIKYFRTENFDLCENNYDKKGNFGKHVIITDIKEIEYNDAINLVKTILKEVKMTPIYDMLIDYSDEKNFDILQPIAESHISIHRKEKEIIIYVFSCKGFDDNKILRLLDGKTKNITQIQRGVKYK